MQAQSRRLVTGLKFLVCVAVCQAAGFLGSIFTTKSIPTWYAGITKPAITPPNWVFGPVWTTLFLLMGVALFMVWLRGSEKAPAKMSFLAFVAQLVLNVLWSVLFFGLQSPGAAFIEIVFLWLAILWTIMTFSRVSRAAAILLVPYIAWVSFASVLNFMIWRLNA